MAPGSWLHHSQFLHSQVLERPGSVGSDAPLAHSGFQPLHVVHTWTFQIPWSFRTGVGSLKCPLLLILLFHWRSSSWGPGLARCSRYCLCYTCHSDIQWLLGTYIRSLHGEHSQGLSLSHTPAPWRYMLSGYCAWLGPCTPDPEEFRKERVRLQYSGSFCLA